MRALMLAVLVAGCGVAEADGTSSALGAASDPIVGSWSLQESGGAVPSTLGFQFNADGTYLQAVTFTLADGTLATVETAGTYIDNGTVQYVASLNPPPGGSAVILTPTASSCPASSPTVAVQLPSARIAAHVATAATLTLTSPGTPPDVLSRVASLAIGTVGCSSPAPFQPSPLAPL